MLCDDYSGFSFNRCHINKKKKRGLSMLPLDETDIEQLATKHRVHRITRLLFGPLIRGFLSFQALFKPPIEQTKVNLRNKLHEASIYTETNATQLEGVSRHMLSPQDVQRYFREFKQQRISLAAAQNYQIPSWPQAKACGELQDNALLHIVHALHHPDSHLKTFSDPAKLRIFEQTVDHFLQDQKYTSIAWGNKHLQLSDSGNENAKAIISAYNNLKPG